MWKLGLTVNPVAGMGGRVGLKGTDGAETLKKALSLGANPVAPRRAIDVLNKLKHYADSFQLVTYPHEMGGDEASEAGLPAKIVGSIIRGMTTAEDTFRSACDLKSEDADLILFVGGDGTARDIFKAIGTSVVVLGVPSGVKTYSSVFAANPDAAAEAVLKYFKGKLDLHEAEVLDIDEEAFRQDKLEVKLYGYLKIPFEPTLIQGSKSASTINEDERSCQNAVAKHVAEAMERDVVYVIGPGTTTKAFAEYLGLNKTLLGVDVVEDGKVTVKDADERAILKAVEGRRAKIVVTPIGNQGFIFGRGNQQISPDVVKKVGRENILIIATHSKLRNLKQLRVDTGDSSLDRDLKGYFRVVTDYREETVLLCV